MTDDTEGFALFATDHPVEITEAMVAAGIKAAQDGDGKRSPEIVKAIFEAMCRAAPPEPDWDEWPSEDSIETVTAEVSLAPESVEALAIRAAKGNNGGQWATHYTEGQREHWRQFVRDLATSALSAPKQIKIVKDAP